MRHPVVCVPAALVIFGIGIISAAADDRQTCDGPQGGEAIAACGRLINLNPDDAHAYLDRGVAYLRKAD